MFVFVRFYGFDFLHAGAAARALNVVTNGAALAYFAARGHVLWHVGAAISSAPASPCAAAARSCARRSSSS
jgi:hypothetical protein